MAVKSRESLSGRLAELSRCGRIVLTDCQLLIDTQTDV